MNKYQNIYHVPLFFFHQRSVLVPEQTLSTGRFLLKKDLVDLEESRVRLIAGVDHAAVDLIILYEAH